MATLIEVKRTGHKPRNRYHGDIVFTARFSGGRPTAEEVAAAQLAAGYHPAGYGGPWDVKTAEAVTPGEWVATFQCADSCD